MGKYVLGISRSEVASKVFINACNEFQFLESVATRRTGSGKAKKSGQEDNGDEAQLVKLIESILDENQTAKRCSQASWRARCCVCVRILTKKHVVSTFFQLLTKLSKKYDIFKVWRDNYNVMIFIRR